MSDSPGAVDAARENGRPPRDNLVRAMRGGVAVRKATRAEGDAEPSENANGMPTMFGHFSTFNEWYEVNSYFEGHFLERVAPSAYKKTLREQTPVVLYNHGQDPQLGDKPLGAPTVLREDETGPYYEVPLLDASYVRDLVPALEAGLLGSSFRFSVMREEWVEEPGMSEDNPAGIPERTIKEMRVSEFGPVTFPANPSATAGVRSSMRSMTDEYLVGKITSQPEGLRAIIDYLEQRDSHTSTRPERDAAAVTDEAAAETETEIVERTAPDVAEAEIAVIEEAETGAPGPSLTPLYFGKQNGRKATPGSNPTSLYIGKNRHKRKGGLIA